MINLDYEIIIVGCGPTGATFANYFGQQNIKTLIIDKETEIIDYPRAVHIDEDVVRIFQELKLYDQMKNDGIKPFKNYALVNKNNKTLFKFSPNSSISEEIPSCNWILQPEIEKHLRQGFSKYDCITFLKGTSLTEIFQDNGFITVHLKDNTGNYSELKSKYLIASDGGKSLIRKKFDIPVHDFGFKKNWMVIDTEYQGTQSFSEDHKQYCNPKQPITYVNGVKNHFRWEFMVKPKDELLNENELLKKMLPYLEKNFPMKDFKILRKKVYTFHTVIAEKWRINNVFLAGDAAHQMPPFLGQGMCSGIKDAKNLSWKISIACKKSTNGIEKLLNSYEGERKPQVVKIIKLAAILGGFIQYSNPYLYKIRNGVLKFINVLPSKPIDKLIEKHLYSIPLETDLSLTELSGQRFPQPIIHTKDKVCYFDDIVHQNWAILYKNTSIPDYVLTFIKKIELVKSIPKENQIVSSYLEKWMKAKKIDLVIIRPDKFILYAGKKEKQHEILKKTIKFLTKLNYN